MLNSADKKEARDVHHLTTSHALHLQLFLPIHLLLPSQFILNPCSPISIPLEMVLHKNLMSNPLISLRFSRMLKPKILVLPFIVHLILDPLSLINNFHLQHQSYPRRLHFPLALLHLLLINLHPIQATNHFVKLARDMDTKATHARNGYAGSAESKLQTITLPNVSKLLPPMFDLTQDDLTLTMDTTLIMIVTTMTLWTYMETENSEVV